MKTKSAKKQKTREERIISIYNWSRLGLLLILLLFLYFGLCRA